MSVAGPWVWLLDDELHTAVFARSPVLGNFLAWDIGASVVVPAGCGSLAWRGGNPSAARRHPNAG